MASSPHRRHLLPASDVSASRSPPWLVTFVALLLVRLTGAAYALISDCDETFNYWEALHLVLFGGRPVQTWEYSPEFAIRSWAYILAHAPAGLVAKLAGFSKVSWRVNVIAIRSTDLDSPSSPPSISHALP